MDTAQHGAHTFLTSRRYDPLALPRLAYAFLLLNRLVFFGILLAIPATILGALISLGAGVSDPGLNSQPYLYLISLAMAATILIWTVVRDFAARHPAEGGEPQFRRNLLLQVANDDIPSMLSLWMRLGRNRPALRVAGVALVLMWIAALTCAIIFLVFFLSPFASGQPPLALGWISLALVLSSVITPAILPAVLVRRPASDAPLPPQLLTTRQRKWLWRITFALLAVLLAIILSPALVALVQSLLN